MKYTFLDKNDNTAWECEEFDQWKFREAITLWLMANENEELDYYIGLNYITTYKLVENRVQKLLFRGKRQFLKTVWLVNEIRINKTTNHEFKSNQIPVDAG